METHTTRSNISFVEGNQYAILRFKCSKTIMNYFRVQIILAATGKAICSIAALWQVFQVNPQLLANVPLFCLNSRAFFYQSVVMALRKRLVQTGIIKIRFFEHSFSKKIAKYKVDQGMLNKSIQRLGHWTFNIFKLCFKSLLTTFYNLNFSF